MAVWLRALLAALAILAFSDAAALGNDGSPATTSQTAPSATPPSIANPSIPEAKYAAPPPSASSTDPQRSDIAVANLPRDLSPWKMFLSADVIVKGVMIGLAFASMLTWTVGFAKGIELVSRKRSLRRTLQSISDVPSLKDASAQLGRRSNALGALVNVAAHELRLSSGIADRQGVKERVQSRLDRIEIAAARDMNRGTGILATIGSTAPFIGLFGTVWGIMNSFVGISQAQTTNLAVVAPGIAEALLATAFGLVAAIPAVFIYNLFARSLASYKALVGDAGAEVMRLVSRDLDRGIVSRWHAPKAAE
jgi:biopolymer transport protein ExbB